MYQRRVYYFKDMKLIPNVFISNMLSIDRSNFHFDKNFSRYEKSITICARLC